MPLENSKKEFENKVLLHSLFTVASGKAWSLRLCQEKKNGCGEQELVNRVAGH